MSWRVTQTEDHQGHTTSISYDASGFQNTHQMSVGSNITSFTYDRYGRDSVVSDPLSHATTMTYDRLNWLTSTTQPGSATTTTSFTRNATLHTLTTTVTDPRSLHRHATLAAF